jgi:CBS domain-containing protein
MTVSKLCCREVQTARPGDLVRDVAANMQQHRVGTVVVVNARRQPVGIVTDRDLALRIIAANRLPSATRIEDVMTVDPQLVQDDATAEGALDLMRRHGVQRLPVVDIAGRLVGIISLRDLVSQRDGTMLPKHVVEAIERSSGEIEC